MTGAFITFEGGEGAGKSTQVTRLAEVLRARGVDVLVTREPGGSPGAEAVRHVILSGAAEKYGAETEALLFAAARNDHVTQVIRPAVQAGKIVLCDRFLDSSRVYQGLTGNLDPGFMCELEAVAIDGMMPDLTLILDIDPAEGLARAAKRRAGPADRYEKEAVATHQRRREGFLAIAGREPERCKVIDAADDPEAVAAAILKQVLQMLRRTQTAASDQPS